MSPTHADRLAGQYERSKSGARLPRGTAAIDAPKPLQSIRGTPTARTLNGMASRRRAPRPRNTATGREADALLHQIARDHEEARRARHGVQRSEFQEIRQELDATRLLAALSHSHGILPEKYAVTRGRDGADRIKVGGRHLNVTDFLTKELHLPWEDAAQILRTVYRDQIANDPEYFVRRQPQQELWREYQEYRRAQLTFYREQWVSQGESERRRKAEIREAYVKQRSSIQDNASLKPSERKSQLSLARMARIEKEAALRDAIAVERAELKERSRVRMDDHYREFLSERAQAGDERALAELRRLQRTARSAPKPGTPIIAPARKDHPENAIIYRGALIEHTVHANGDVTYSRGGRALLDDEGHSLRMWEADADAIELGLRLAATKFGNTLELSGPEEFRHAAARVAAEANLYVRFTDDSLNEIMAARQVELRDERKAEQERERARQEAVRQIGRDAIAQQPDQQPGQQQPGSEDSGPAPDIER